MALRYSALSWDGSPASGVAKLFLISLTQEETSLLRGIRGVAWRSYKGMYEKTRTRHNGTRSDSGPRHLLLSLQPTRTSWYQLLDLSLTMESAVQTLSANAAFDREVFPRRALRVSPRGASSQFVGTSIMILSSFAISTLAMNCGKKLQESRQKPHGN